MKNSSVSAAFMLLGILFCTCLIVSNLMAAKIFVVGEITLSAAVLLFPVSYILNDCIAEVWGYRKARLIIWTGFAINFLVMAVFQLAVLLPPSPHWEGAPHFDYVFGLAPRLAAASFMAFLAGSLVNAYVMSRMKLATQGRHFSLRAVVSTLLGEGVDSLIFFPCAYLGLLPLKEMLVVMAGEVLLKVLYEIAVLPLTRRVVQYVKRVEGVDVFDEKISYNPLKICDIG
ncbi:MAG: queuosine precursor transporter [Mailhella sp.]|nr:queuosine precursor transporter [Mailhella sp.]MBQ3171488.1 queuosine precursor transporter [Mailhella sp.]MBQ4616450.1 queuosine precursor transporter [Mailhella sp.]